MCYKAYRYLELIKICLTMDIKKKIKNKKNNQSLEIFIMNDQPFTCPYCGSRCIEIASFYHTNAKSIIEECMNAECGFVGYELEDEEFLRLWKII